MIVMAEIRAEDLQVPPHASVHRQRFYLLRHGQSLNNLYSTQDDAGRPPEDSHMRQPQQDHKRLAQQERERRLLHSPGNLAQQADHQVPHRQQLHVHHDEQGKSNLDKQETHQKEIQRHLFCCQDFPNQQQVQGQEGLFLPVGGDLHSVEAGPEYHQAERLTKRAADPPLTEVGRRQAAAAGEWMQRHVQQMLLRSQSPLQHLRQAREELPTPAIKKIVCSPMRRAVETAAELMKIFSVEVYVHPLLFEQGGLFRGPRKVPPPSVTASRYAAASPAFAEGSACCDASREAEAVESAADSSSETSTANNVKYALREVCDKSCRKKFTASPTARKACRRSGAPEGLTLQEVKALLPGVKIIIPSCDRPRHPSLRVGNGDQAPAADATTHRNTDTSCRCAAQRNSKAGSTSTRRESELGADVTGAAESPDDVTQKPFTSVQKGALANTKEAEGRYCEGWTRGGRSWWSGGREKLLDTVTRAAEIVLWMRNECQAAQSTGGSVLMVMHGLMMDLLVKTLMYPFPSEASAYPYLDLLAQSLRAHERATGRPLYNMPQQAAYFTSSNCSICCFELAAAAQERPLCVSDGSLLPRRKFSRVSAHVLVEDWEMGRRNSAAFGRECPTELQKGLANGKRFAGGKQQLEHQKQQRKDDNAYAESMNHVEAGSLSTSAVGFAGSCWPTEGTKKTAARNFRIEKGDPHAAASAPKVEQGARELATKVLQETSQDAVAPLPGSERDAADLHVMLTAALRSADTSDTSAVTFATRSAAAPVFRRSGPAPALVSALIEWNVPAVDPQLYTGHTLGSSVLMFC